MIKKIFGTFALLCFLIPFSGKAQQDSCGVFFSPDTLSITCGDSVTLTPFVGSNQLGSDFNDSLDPGWEPSPNLTPEYYDSLGCLQCPVSDGTPFIFFGPSANQPRTLTTAQMNVECGGQICFDLQLCVQGNQGSCPTTCEGPDLPDEGVHLQYSIDNGTSWTEIFYFNPDTNGVGGGASSPFTCWDNYCFNIPPAAQTDTTKFRFYQQTTSSNQNDHWALDNVFINGSACDSFAFDWNGDSIFVEDHDTTVAPDTSTTYTVSITDSADTCSADVFVQVNKPQAQAMALDSLMCSNDTTQLIGANSCYYVLDMDDSFGDGWNGGALDVYLNGNLEGTHSASGTGSVDTIIVGIGDSLSLEYTSGAFESENEYWLMNSVGDTIFSDGPSPSTGFVFWTTVQCDGNYTTPSGFDFAWTPDSTLSDSSIVDPYAFPDDTTTYLLEMYNDVPGCSTFDSVTVNVEPWGGNTTFSYSSGTYCWDAPNQTPTVNGVQSGTFSSSPGGLVIDPNTGEIDIQASAADSTYMVYYTTPGTICSFTDSVPITIDTNTVADFHYPDTVYCETSDSAIVQYLGGGSQGNFYTNDTALALDSITGIVDISNSDTGSYWVYNEIPSSGSCPFDLDSAQIIIEVKPVATAGNDTSICEGDTVMVNGSYSGGASTVNWYTLGDGTFNNNNLTDPEYYHGSSDVANGSVELIVESDSISACNVSRDTMVVDITPQPTVDAGPNDTVCDNMSYTVNGSVGGSATGLQWGTTGDGFYDDVNAMSTTYHPGSNDISNGTVTLYVTSTNPAVCQQTTDSMELTIQAAPDPTFSYPNAPFCENSGTNPSPTISGDSGGVFTVSPANGLVFVNDSTGEINMDSTYAGTFNITYVVGTACPDSSSVQIEILPEPPAPSATGNDACIGSTDTLMASGTGSLTWYSDANGNNVVQTGGEYVPPQGDVDVPGKHWYYVSQTVNGCTSQLTPVALTIYPQAEVSFDADPQSGVIPLEVSFTNTSGSAVSGFSWNFDNGVVMDSVRNPGSQIYENKGVYTVVLTAFNDTTGCYGSAKRVIETFDEPVYCLPNVFSPNDGNNKNNEFKPELTGDCGCDNPTGNCSCLDKNPDIAKPTCWDGIESFQGTIYNRWGNKVHEWSNWDNAWDGGNSPQGTYYYVITIVGDNGDNVEVKGNVTLLRENN